MSNYNYNIANDFLDISNLSGGLYNNSSNNNSLPTSNSINNFGSYDGGLQGYGRPHDSEDQLLFRLPPQLAERVRNMMKQKHMDMPIDFQFKNDRQIIFKFGEEQYNANLVDLPCIVESHKTYDKSNYYKTADIGQMIIVNDKENNNNDNTDNNNNENIENSENNNNNNNSNNNNKNKNKKDNTLPPNNVVNNMLTSGLTPASKDIVKRKFRVYNREKITELAKIEEELVRIIKPAYGESEEIEFVCLPDLKDKYGNELFSSNSTEPVIFEEKADEQLVIDDMDSNDESGLEDEPDQIRTIKVKNMGGGGTIGQHQQQLQQQRRFNMNRNDDDFSDDDRYSNRGKPISSADRSPLEKERSPNSNRRGGSSGGGDRRRGSDKGRERSFGSSFVNMNNPSTPAVNINTSSNSIGSMSQSGSTPTSLKIKFSIPSSPSIESLNNSIKSPEDLQKSTNSIIASSSSTPILSPSQKSPISPRSNDEKKKHRHRDRGDGEHKRRKKERSSNTDKNNDSINTPITSPQQPTMIQLDSSMQDLSASTNNNINNNNSNNNNNNNISSPPIQFNEPTTPQQQLNISSSTNSISTPNTNTNTNNKTTSPLNQASSSIQPISSMSISTSSENVIVPNTPPSASVSTPPLQVSTPPISQSSSNTIIQQQQPITNNDSELLNLISSLRKLQQEAESLKRQLAQLQTSLNTAPNKILKERQQVKVDDATKQLNSKLKEIENVENSIQEIKNKDK